MPNASIDVIVQKRIQSWLDGPYDAETKAKIKQMLKEDPQGLVDAFYTDLSFGTGGLRGIMGVGTNRMNRYTIQTATQGLANYLISQFTSSSNCGVVIGYDSRHHSRLFAEVAAQVLAGNGIHVYLLKDMRPTPYVSFAVRYKNCQAGIMITASHNPAEYNGYKVYWQDGAQVVHPHDLGITKAAEKIQEIAQIKSSTLKDPLIEIVDDKLDEAYLAAIRPLQHFPEINKKEGKNVSIAYTSLHGVGITLAPKALTDWGFSNIHYVKEQIEPNGDFPTVKSPNPENKEALTLGIHTMQQTESDILIANDPDADRIGCVVLHQGNQVIINGNEMAALCAEYIAEVLKKTGKLPKNGAFITTIVTTELLKEIAKAYNVQLCEVLTGFKYIGEKIHQWEIQKSGELFLFGAEESYGYLIGTHARDKDAIVLSCLIAEMTLFAKKLGQTLVDRLHTIYRKYGVFKEKQLSLNFNPGKEGMDQIQRLMTTLRKKAPSKIGNKAIKYIEDYESLKRTYLDSKKTERLTLPPSDVLLFRLDDDSRLVIRPSGTEPKIKIYAGCQQKEFKTIENGIAACDNKIDALLNEAKRDLSQCSSLILH
ncbi:MAG TPA: phospho-sugar mutase [Rhabdochlamydiaceae bacterium]|nr:phospho-sugar mutase [Rhabdochlamydiaceae bacterium]